mmetsp:Transcript_77921/g.167180  ORF Transcript_77921/g.167180 Transcript_77921/m.167180 type:complete len:1036 (-) Transcript_77921:28-3135(-)
MARPKVTVPVLSSGDRVMAALERDGHRDLERQRTLDAGRGSLDGDEGEGLPTAIEHFQALSRKAALAMHLADQGIKTRHVLKGGPDWKFAAQRRKQELKDFLALVLNSGALMAKTSQTMRSLHGPLFSIDKQAFDGAALMNMIARAMHDVKAAVVTTVYLDHVQRMQSDYRLAERRYKELQAQFKEARTTYLQEVSLLRDHVRTRGDPLDGISLDVTWFYDPTQTLMESEKAFFLNLLREKLKMIFEENPQVTKTFDFGQIEKLAQQVESQEQRELKEALKKKCDEYHDLEKYCHEVAKWNNSGGAKGEMPSFGAQEEALAAKERLVEELFAEKEKLRKQFEAEEHSRLSVQEERDYLFNQYNDELATSGSLQTRFNEVTSQVASLEADLSKEKATINHLEEALREAQQKNSSLQKKFKRRSSSRKSGGVALEDEALPDRLGEESLDMEKSAEPLKQQRTLSPVRAREADDAGGQGEVRQDSKESQGEDIRTAEEKAEDAIELTVEEVSKENAELKRKNEELMRMLDKHLQSAASREVEDSIDVAEEFSEYAAALGVGVPSMRKREALEARTCSCGNVLMDDSMFCRKCGAEWTDESQKTQSGTVATISTKIGDLDQALSSAVDNLNRLRTAMANFDSLKSQERGEQSGLPLMADGTGENHGGAGGGAGAGTGEAGCVVAANGASEGAGAWMVKLMTAEEEVAHLQREKLCAEAQMLIERSKDAFRSAAAYDVFQTPGETCTCQCAEELDILRQLFNKLKTLCTQLVTKLQAAVVLNSKLSGTLASVQKTLDATASAMGTSAAELAGSGDLQSKIARSLRGIKEAKHRCVYHRLYEDAANRDERRRRRMALLEETCAVMHYADGVDHPIQGAFRSHAISSGTESADHAHSRYEQDGRMIPQDEHAAKLHSATVPVGRLNQPAGWSMKRPSHAETSASLGKTSGQLRSSPSGRSEQPPGPAPLDLLVVGHHKESAPSGRISPSPVAHGQTTARSPSPALGVVGVQSARRSVAAASAGRDELLPPVTNPRRRQSARQ